MYISSVLFLRVICKHFLSREATGEKVAACLIFIILYSCFTYAFLYLNRPAADAFVVVFLTLFPETPVRQEKMMRYIQNSS